MGQASFFLTPHLVSAHTPPKSSAGQRKRLSAPGAAPPEGLTHPRKSLPVVFMRSTSCRSDYTPGQPSLSSASSPAYGFPPFGRSFRWCQSPTIAIAGVISSHCQKRPKSEDSRCFLELLGGFEPPTSSLPTDWAASIAPRSPSPVEQEILTILK